MRLLAMLWVLLLCLTPFGAGATQEDTEQAVRAARAYLQARLQGSWAYDDLSPVAAEPRVFEGDRDACLVSFFVPFAAREGAFFWAYVAADTLEVLAASEEIRMWVHDGTAEMSYILAETERWERDRGPFVLWPYEEKAAFSIQYGYAPGYGRVLRGLPGADDLSYAQAVARLQEVMGQALGAPPSFLDGFSLDAGFLPQTPGDASTGSWLFVLREDRPDVYGLPTARMQIMMTSPSGEADILFLAPSSDADPVSAAALPATLGYNAAGGKYFHAADACVSVNKAYLPLTMVPKETLLQDGPTQQLRPCPKCILQP